MDDLDRRLLDRLQYGLPLEPHPYAGVAKQLECSEEELLARLQRLLDDGTLTRFGPMFDIEPLGGAFALAAMSVPGDRFDEVAAHLQAMPEVAHNYRREHHLNMWFVLACASPEQMAATLARLEDETGLPVLSLPKEATYHVGLHFPL
ncbi:AsnC-like ligand binding domain protein [compost metagenome]